MLKKIGLTSALLALTHMASAGAMIPTKTSPWSVGFEALYLINDSNQESDIDEGGRFDYGAGLYIEAGYQFDSNRDVTINNFYYDKKSSWDYDDGEGNLSHTTQSKVNIFNLELGQKIKIGGKTNLRYHIGLQHANITDFGMVNNVDESNILTSGFGPRVGVSVEQHLKNNMGIYAETSIALLRGKIDDKADEPAGREVSNNALSTSAHIGAYYNKVMIDGSVMFKLGWGINAIDYNGWSEHYVTRNSWSGFNLGMKWTG